MVMPNPGKQLGGEAFHVRDCYVWAEIQYLDSPTDYREYLPQRTTFSSGRTDFELVITDPTLTNWTASLLCFLVCGVIVCLALYCLL